MNWCSKSGIEKYAPNIHIHVQIIHRVVMFSSVDPLTIEKTASVWWTVAGDTCRLCDHSILSQLLDLSDSLFYWMHRVAPSLFFQQPVSLSHLQHSQFQIRKGPHLLIPPFVATRFPVAVSIKPPRFASCSRAWELDAASDFEFLLILHRSYEYSRTFGCHQTFCGWGTCRDNVRFIAVDFDFATLLSFPFCSCILFAIVLAQLIKLEFWAQWDGWWRRLFRSLRVKSSLVKMSASWCLVALHQIWILESRSILSKQPIQSNSEGLWNMSHCGTSTFDDHSDYHLIVLEDTQHSIGSGMCSAWWNVINFGHWCSWFESVFACLIEDLPTSFTVALLHLWLCWFVLGRNEILQSLNKSQISRAGIPSMRKPASKEITSASVELWNRSLFLAHPTYWHERVTSENALDSSWCWLRVFKVSCKIRVLE